MLPQLPRMSAIKRREALDHRVFVCARCCSKARIEVLRHLPNVLDHHIVATCAIDPEHDPAQIGTIRKIDMSDHAACMDAGIGPPRSQYMEWLMGDPV